MAEFREELHDGPWLGARRRIYANCDSSNDRLWQWIDEGAPSGALVLSAAQSSGRGRQGRAWLSEPGQGLYFSAFVAPDLGARELPAAGLVSALALCDLLAARGAEDFGIKWPNDLLLRGRKLAGILVESRNASSPQLVIGIGLNLRPPSGGWPAELRERAISLEEAALEHARDQVADALCRHLQSRIEAFQSAGFAALVDDFLRFDLLRGRTIDYALGGEDRRGVADGVESDGALRVVDATGSLHRLYAGEVHLRP